MKNIVVIIGPGQIGQAIARRVGIAFPGRREFQL